MSDAQARPGEAGAEEPPISPAEELRRLVGAARSQLQWLADQGVAWVPGGRSPRLLPAEALAPPAEATPAFAPAAAAAVASPSARGGPEGATASTTADPAERAGLGAAAPVELQALPGGARGLARIRQVLGDCARCRLASGRIQLVFGQGDPEAFLMFVGEAPGRDEDLAGEAFVGAAGALLTKMIGAMGLGRDQVYITNVIKCRPPRNRDPEPDEIATCAPFVRAQIEAVQPEVLVTLGRHAAQTLLATDAPVGRLRGSFHGVEIGGRRIPVMPTYHPAYLLRNAEAKRPVWEDLKQVIALLRERGLLPT